MKKIHFVLAVSGQTVAMSYGTASPKLFLYEFIAAPITSDINQAGMNYTRIISLENGIHVIGSKATSISIYNPTGVIVKDYIV